jgi:hypothetical protein
MYRSATAIARNPSLKKINVVLVGREGREFLSQCVPEPTPHRPTGLWAQSSGDLCKPIAIQLNMSPSILDKSSQFVRGGFINFT